jgi:DNA polymerase-3 subunit alpha (Gram-positive type)
VLVAHNARFDIGFITAKYLQLLGKKTDPVYLDTLGLARSVWPNFKSYRLNNVAKELGIRLQNHHRATDDAQCAADILLKALDKLSERKMERLADLNSLIKESGVEHLKTYHIIIMVKNRIGM